MYTGVWNTPLLIVWRQHRLLHHGTTGTIGDVVKSLCCDGKVQLALNAAHKKQLDYICQYEESDFDFVRRLALQYQEWMYYDGLKLVFGKPRRLPDPIQRWNLVRH